jgi:hypothetical protein
MFCVAICDDEEVVCGQIFFTAEKNYIKNWSRGSVMI